MTVEELEEEIHAALDGAVWITVNLRKISGSGPLRSKIRGHWLLTINGKYFDMPSKKAGMWYLSLFFLKASTMKDISDG